MSKSLEWYEVYDELAKAMKRFHLQHGKQSGQELYRLIQQKQDKAIKLFPFMEKFFLENGVKSFDPIHVFASFNNFDIATDTREQKIKFYAEIFELDHSLLINAEYDAFKYFPHINIVHVVARRKLKYQREIWSFFEAIMDEQEEMISKYFDSSQHDWYGVKVVALTIFMFWIKSNKYIPLDKNTVHFLQTAGVISKVPKNYQQYIQLNGRIKGFNSGICRNIACLAISNKYESELSKEERQEIKQFIQLDNLDNFKDIAKKLDIAVNRSANDSAENRCKRLANVKDLKPSKSIVKITVYSRNADVIVEVLKRANGVCEYCEKEAPFKKKNEDPYLEVHHIIPLSENGDDTVGNAMALCPNCHKEAHFGIEQEKYRNKK